MGENSPKYTLAKKDLKAIGRGAMVAMVGAALTYLTAVMADADFGPWTPMIASGFAILANIIRKWMSGPNQY